MSKISKVVEEQETTVERRPSRIPWDGELYQDDWPKKRAVDLDIPEGLMDQEFMQNMQEFTVDLTPLVVGLAYAPEGLQYYLVTGDGKLFSRYLNFRNPETKETLPKSEWTKTSRWHQYMTIDENGQETKEPFMFSGGSTQDTIAAWLNNYRQCRTYRWKDLVAQHHKSARPVLNKK